MSSYKRRSKDMHSPSSEKKRSMSNPHSRDDMSGSYEKHRYERGGNRHGDNEHRDYEKNKKHHHSKERNYEKAKQSKIYESDGEQYERRESRYSEISEDNRRQKKDRIKVVNYADGRDSQAREYRTYDDDNDYYSRSKARESNSEHKSYNRKEKERQRSDKNSSQPKEDTSDEDGDSDYYSGNKVRNKNHEHDSQSRKDRRHEKYDSEGDYNSSEFYSRNSHPNDHLSDYDGDDHYSSNKVKVCNSERSAYNGKDKNRKKSDHSYDSNSRYVRRNETDHNGDSRAKDDRRRRDISPSERESFYGRRGSTRQNHSAQAVAEVNQDIRNREGGKLDGDAQNEKNKGANSNDAKASKKMISGAYIPPAKLRLMQQEITDKGSIEYQKISWEALKKSINGLTNKINASNIVNIVKELFKENIIRGRGVLARALMQAQALSPTFTHVYAALVAVINTKFPEISELLLKRLILLFKRGFRRNDKQACLSSVRFVAHLLNQQVAHEVLALEILTLLLEHPTDHSVEVAIAMLKECGKRLEELSKRGCDAIFSRLRHVLHEGNLDKRTQYMIEVLFAVRKDKFKDYPSVIEELDLVEENDKFTHLVTLDEALESEEMLNVFKFDPEYQANEERYKELVKEILGDSDSEESGDSEAEGEDSEEETEEGGESQKIVDMTETNLVALRRNIYLTIRSSVNFEECAHKLLKMELKPGEIIEMCYMILDCCAQERTYEKFYGLLAQRFCQLNKVYMEPFMEIFRNSYETIHRLETNKLRNVAKFFAHLLYTDAIHWNVLSNIKLNENDTTSSGRIFIKILFQELCEYMGLPLLNERVKDVTLQEAFDGLFPRDNPHNTRFAINFFTSIGLGGLTDELREHLKSAPKNPAVVQTINKEPSEGSSDDSSEDSPSSSENDSDDEEPPRKKKKSQS